MSLHKKAEMDTLDISLKHSLKNWVAATSPPSNGKRRLLQAASNIPQRRQSRLAAFLVFAMNDDYINIHLERSTILSLNNIRANPLLFS